MKVVNIAYAMIKLQFKLPQTLISRGFTRRTVLHAPAFQKKVINQLMDIYQIWKPSLQDIQNHQSPAKTNYLYFLLTFLLLVAFF